jgi:hypothetical protein
MYVREKKPLSNFTEGHLIAGLLAEKSAPEIAINNHVSWALPWG